MLGVLEFLRIRNDFQLFSMVLKLPEIKRQMLHVLSCHTHTYIYIYMAVGHKLLLSVIGRKSSPEGGGITRVGPGRKSEAKMAFKRRQTNIFVFDSDLMFQIYLIVSNLMIQI